MPPALLPEDAYRHAFKLLMALVGVATIAVAALILVRLGASSRRLYGTLSALALAPLALGPVSLNTYDVWPAFLVAAAVYALLAERAAPAFALLGLAFTAKLYPVALLPVFCIAVGGWRQLLRPLAAFVGVVAAVVGPFALVGWDGLWRSVESQVERSLQIESLGGSLLLAAYRLDVYDAEVVRGSTLALSRDLAGSLPDAAAFATGLAQALAVLLVAWLYARSSGGDERFIAATAATVACFLAFSRFLSPQYLVWLVPLVPLVAPPFSVAASGLLAIALVLAQLWFHHYREVFALEGIVWLVVARDLLLLALAAVLALAVVRLRTKIPSSSRTVVQRPDLSSRASGTAAVEGAERRSR
jgi:hypothetical protein